MRYPTMRYQAQPCGDVYPEENPRTGAICWFGTCQRCFQPDQELRPGPEGGYFCAEDERACEERREHLECQEEMSTPFETYGVSRWS